MRFVASLRPSLLLVVLGLACAACDAQEDDLEDARDRWNRAGLVSYDYQFRSAGFSGPPVNATISVKGGVASAVDPAGKPLPSFDATTIPQLFDAIEREIQAGADVSTTYDAQLGFPHSATFSYGGEGDTYDIPQLTPH